jgi:hypothetical protein
LQQVKHPVETAAIIQERVTTCSRPRYRIRQSPEGSTTNSPETLKNRFPGSIVTVRTSEPAIARPVTWQTLAGRHINPSDAQPKKAKLPIVASLLPASNIKSERVSQSSKAYLEMASTDEGIQMDPRDRNCANALSASTEMRQPASNVNFKGRSP